MDEQPRNDRFGLGVFLTRIGGEIAAAGGRCYHADIYPSVREELRDTLEQAISRLNAYELQLASEPALADEHQQELAARVADFMAFRDARGGL
ncbi:MAG: hypothetical protein WC807_18620 [Hyphomicrobium sp.]|jgi:hypothetical protein